MNAISQTPTYNLKAVLKETGLTADVLRAWERRYGLPVPQRTPGGHRLYSEYDVETVKWLKARQEEGLSISRAVELWKDLLDSGRDPLAEYPTRGAQPMVGAHSAADTQVEILHQNWLNACLAFDEIRAEETLNQAFAVYPMETVCTAILQSGLHEIGEKWYHGEASVQQEHFASALAVRRLDALIAATPRPTREQRLLLGCPPGEWHTFPVLLLNLILRRRGLAISYLGAHVPIEQMQETSAAIRPELIVLAAQQLTTASSLRSMAVVFQESGAVLGFGGLIFNRLPKLRERIPAYFLGESLEEAIQPVEQLVAKPIPFPTAFSVDETYRELAYLFREKRPQIEMNLSENLQRYGLPVKYLDEANFFFGNGLNAALALGGISFLEADLKWIQRLFAGQEVPKERLIPYLAAYSQVAREIMGRGLVSDWIDQYIAQHKVAHLSTGNILDE